MLQPSSALARLLDAPVRAGALIWIGARPERRAPMQPLEEARLEPGQGLIGDRWRGRPDGSRQVTLIGAEDLAAIGAFVGLGRPAAPEQLRRNLVTRGVNLLALKSRRFRIGDAVLEHAGECHPCSRLEEALGEGGYNAVRGHGGICAKVIVGGAIRVGDAVVRLDG